MAAVRLTALVMALLVPAVAVADEVDDATLAKLEELRRAKANEIQLSAYNLVDELVYGWTKTPVFQQETDVVLAGVTVPVGLGTALSSLVENHINDVLIKNPSTRMTLTHCPACTAMIVHSGREGTVISRGVDNPEAFDRLRRDTTTKYALFVDIEAEGTSLVLRARITKLDTSLSIVWARTIASASDTRSMLREADDIKSVEEARQELMAAVEDRWPLVVPARISVRFFSDGGSTGVNPPPFVWIQSGVELALSQERAWTASFLLGYGWVPSSYDGFMAQVRIHRLLTGESRSYVRPDAYAFLGASLFAVQGPSALIFQRDQLTTEDILAIAQGNDQPIQIVSTVHAGLELRIGNRMGLNVFAELLPAHIGSNNLGLFLDLFHSLGTEVSVWF
ncbi:MAG: hypothetical protein RIT81_16935 [Deltaproteobacteria bacterium]